MYSLEEPLSSTAVYKRYFKDDTIALDLFSCPRALPAHYQQLEHLLDGDLSEEWIVNMAM